MKLVLISTDRSVFIEGSAVRKRMESYSSFLEELHVIVFARRETGYKKHSINNAIRLYPTNSFSKWNYVTDAIRLGKTIANADLVSAQDPFETGFAGWRVARQMGAKLQIQIHTDFLSPYFKHTILNRIRVLFARFLLPRADCIRVVSKRIARSLQATSYKLQATPVVLPIFVDVEKLRAQKPRLNLRARYKQFDRILLIVSRLEREKNVAAALTALAEVQKSHPRAGLIIVGGGSERPRLETMAAALGLGRLVIFEGWQSDVISYYKTADVVLNPSLYEGYGLTVAEALACGTPVLSTEVGAAHEMGATIADIETFGSVLSNMLAEPCRAELKSYPYESFEGYLKGYKKALEHCLNRK